MTRSVRQLDGVVGAVPALSDQEVAQLRDLLSVARFDPVSGSLRVKVGEAKLLLRRDGTVRIEGRSLVQMAEGTIRLDGAVIELN